MAFQLLLPSPFSAFFSSFTSSSSSSSSCHSHQSFCLCYNHIPHSPALFQPQLHHFTSRLGRRNPAGIVSIGREDTELRTTPTQEQDGRVDRKDGELDEDEDYDELDPDPQDLEYISQIKRVLELLRKNRDMLFGEVKLTIMIEDPREVERKRLLGIDEDDTPTRDDLVAALEEVNEGKIPKNRVALRVLAEEMVQWPNLEVEAPENTKPSKSLYAKATDTGVNPKEAAKRLNIDWDSAAEIEDPVSEDAEVPSAVGYGALYLVTAFPVIIASDVLSCMDMQLGAYGTSKRVTDTKADGSNFNGELMMLEHKKDLQREKRISVDPASLEESANVDMVAKSIPLLPPPLIRAKFLSTSLPNSASSSPCFSSSKLKKKLRNQNQEPSVSVALTNLERLRESHFQRSKSCGEGRSSAASVELRVCMGRRSGTINGHDTISYGAETEAKAEEVLRREEAAMDALETKFKCGALCMFLPGFGKGKPVKARKDEAEPGAAVVSRTVSLEKFECGSWASLSAIGDEEGNGNSTLYFDLPLELIRSSSNDADSPVRAAFVFDKDRKGVLKKSASSRGTGRKSQELARQVRFSTSSSRSCNASPASCITPRLRKAREDFNAFLEAQSA